MFKFNAPINQSNEPQRSFCGMPKKLIVSFDEINRRFETRPAL